MTRTDYDEWMCYCKLGVQTKWVSPTVPHVNACPVCGRRGWWQRFVEGDAYSVPEGFPTVGGIR